MSRPETLVNIFEHIDKNKQTYVEHLKNAVAIKSVSSSPKHRQECQQMVNFIADWLRKIGATVDLKDIGTQKVHHDEEIPLPNVIVAQLGNDSNKNTVCIYGHLDVQPANKSDGWNSEPFELLEKDDKLYGRGSTDDKGPVLCWIHAIEAYQTLGLDIPVNIKFIFEAMEESGSVGLDDLLMNKMRPEGFFDDISYICISDNYWLGTTKPCITYGLRGVCYFFVEVQCASQDLHSGTMGGTVYEAMSDLIYLLNSLVDVNGKILIPGIYEDVEATYPGERESYQNIEFDVESYKESIGAKRLLHNEDKIEILMHRWRKPSLSIHGIQGAVHEPGAKTVIPAKVIGKFSIRIVPHQTPETVAEKVVQHLNEQYNIRNSPNIMKAFMYQGGKPWIADPNNEHYTAAAKATKHVYNVDPDMSREGGSIPVALTLQEASNKSVLLLPVGSGDDMAHSQNEKMNVRNYVEGTKLLGAYLYEVGQLKKQ